jgi:YHS domain-containing protein
MTTINTAKLTTVTPANWSNVTAKNIRTVLKAHYPKTKFSVRKEHYSCINVNWTDFPMRKDVEKLLAPFNINDNDSMTDYAGTKSTAFSEIYGGVQYLFCRQELSEQVQKDAIETMAKQYPLWFNGFEELPLTFENYKRCDYVHAGDGFYDKFNDAVIFVLTDKKIIEDDCENVIENSIIDFNDKRDSFIVYSDLVLSTSEQDLMILACEKCDVTIPNFKGVASITSDILSRLMAV